MNVYEIVTDRIIKALESGNVPWQKPWKTDSAIPRNLRTLKPYRGINVWLLSLTQMTEGFSSPYFLTYKQATELGGHVKAGSKGFPVVFWKTGTREIQTPNGELEEKKSLLMRYYTVFNVSQCEGLKVIPVTPPIPEFVGNDCAEKIVADWKGKPSIQFGGIRAEYIPIFDIVYMPIQTSFISSESMYSTLFHELTHSTGHKNRLNRDLTGRFGKESYSKEELVAEMGAAFLCGHCGIDTQIDQSAAYLRSWIKALQGDSKLVISAASQAQKAADLILGFTEQ